MILTKTLRRGIQSIKLPTVDISSFLEKRGDWRADCKLVAQSFTKYGLIIIKDPRVNAAQNDSFLNLMERYFLKRSQQFDQGNTNVDLSPENHYQIGLTPAYMQKFQHYKQHKLSLSQPNKAVTPLEPGLNPNWRFSWKVQLTKNVIPADFPEMESTMVSWGLNMKNGTLTTAQMLAIGLDFEPKFIVDRMLKGSFNLAPTAVDLQKIKQGDVIVSFHRDFSVLTCHGKARFPGLFSWLNTGQKFMVHVPEGHFLFQGGKQLQWLTGGYITASFHEVVYSSEVQEAKKRAKEQGKSLWRISSTMFSDCQPSVLLEPHPNFASQSALKLYPPITAREQYQSELDYLLQMK